MNTFKIKCMMASVYDVMGINAIKLKKINRKYGNNYIRILNYHHSPVEDKDQFIKQVEWYTKNFEMIGVDDLQRFLNGSKTFTDKPGMLITFDDGYLDNYQVAHQYLSSHGIPAVYMVSAGLVGKKAVRDGMEAEYITFEQLKEMGSGGAAIGCHTYSHHRMGATDTEEVLRHEIIESKQELEQGLGAKVDIFCWCGGEELTYTKAASDMIRTAGYKFGFMTNSAPIQSGCDAFQLDRSNIEAGWPLSLVRFQLSGVIDDRLKEKRDRVHKLTQ